MVQDSASGRTNSSIEIPGRLVIDQMLGFEVECSH